MRVCLFALTEQNIENALVIEAYKETPGLCWKNEAGEYVFVDVETVPKDPEGYTAFVNSFGDLAPFWLTRCANWKQLRFMVAALEFYLRSLEMEGEKAVKYFFNELKAPTKQWGDNRLVSVPFFDLIPAPFRPGGGDIEVII